MPMMPKIEDVEQDLENTPPEYQRQQKPPEVNTGGFIDEVDFKYSSYSFLDLLSCPVQGFSYASNTTTIPSLPGSLNSSSLPSLVPPPPPYVTSLLLLSSTEKPNSPSMSSSSCEVADQARSAVTEAGDEGEKEKLKNQKKRQRQQRFAFVTRTEVNHLEDGYRWRKYGQKAVKNSPFPRNYYRCTSTTCGVKKRVQRSLEDPTVLVTTYEGQHTHAVTPRGEHLTIGGLLFPESTQTPSPFPLPYDSILRSPATRFDFDSASYGGNLGYGRSNPGLVDGTDVVRDHGLLQDLVPPDIRK